MPGLNKADTCRVFITPALQKAGLGDPHWHITEQCYFLRTWFLSTEGMAKICAASAGAAGRNKTLNLKKLEAIQVPILDMPKQRRSEEVYARIQATRKLNAQTAAELEAIMPTALEQAFAGIQ
jgi:hypothetical protein